MKLTISMTIGSLYILPSYRFVAHDNQPGSVHWSNFFPRPAMPALTRPSNSIRAYRSDQIVDEGGYEPAWSMNDMRYTVPPRPSQTIHIARISRICIMVLRALCLSSSKSGYLTSTELCGFLQHPMGQIVDHPPAETSSVNLKRKCVGLTAS